MANTGSSIINGQVLLVKAGTRQRLPTIAAQAPPTSIAVQALSTNEGKIALGGVTVVAAPGTHAAPTTSGILLNPGDTASLDVCDLTAVYMDGTVTGDGIGYIAMLA